MAELSEITSKIITRNLDNFFDSIDLFVSTPKFGNKLGDLFEEGLRVFLKLNITKTVSIHLLNEIDFTFQHRLTLPIDNTSFATNNFEYFINEGFIGKALNNGSALILSKEEIELECPHILLPMIASWGVMGVIIIEIDNTYDELDPYFLKLFQMHITILSSAIERVQIFDNMKMQNSNLEQKVAIRTHKLNQSRNEIEAIFNAVQTSIFVCDNAGTIVSTNQEALNLLEADNKLIGLNFLELIKTSSDNNESRIKTFKNNYIHVIINNNHTNISDQQLIVYSVLDISSEKVAQNALLELNKNLESIVNQRTSDLEDTVILLEKQITERKKAEQEIKKLLEEEKELNILKSKFIKTVSHEFRTPLTVIRSAAQLLDVYGEQLSSDEKGKYTNRVINTVDFLIQLIENVLHVGNNDLKSDNNNCINFNNYINELLKSKFAISKRIIINNIANVYISGNTKTLNVIFVNLIQNALKYSIKDSYIYINIENIDDFARISIINEGIGILESDKKRVFDLFYRGDNVDNITGIGMGLAVAKQCVNLLDGNIYFESAENKETKFVVKLKIADA